MQFHLAREAPVGFVQFVGFEADPLVGDGDGAPVGGERSVHQHVGVGAGVPHRVLQQLGEEVDQLGGVLAVDLDTGAGEQLDPLVLLDFGGSGPDRVLQGHRAPTLALRLAVGQDQQALGVAAHAGGQVVDLEQGVEDLGIVLAPTRPAR